MMFLFGEWLLWIYHDNIQKYSNNTASKSTQFLFHYSQDSICSNGCRHVIQFMIFTDVADEYYYI